MAHVRYFKGNMEPLPTADGSDKMQLVQYDGSIVTRASYIYGQWHFINLEGHSEKAPSTEGMDIIMRARADHLNASLPGEAGAEDYLDANPKIREDLQS